MGTELISKVCKHVKATIKVAFGIRFTFASTLFLLNTVSNNVHGLFLGRNWLIKAMVDPGGGVTG